MPIKKCRKAFWRRYFSVRLVKRFPATANTVHLCFSNLHCSKAAFKILCFLSESLLSTAYFNREVFRLSKRWSFHAYMTWDRRALLLRLKHTNRMCFRQRSSSVQQLQRVQMIKIGVWNHLNWNTVCFLYMLHFCVL